MFDGVPAGPYTVRANLSGFKTASASVRVVAGRTAHAPKLVLEIAAVTQEVTVGPDRLGVSTAPDANRDAVVMDAPALREIPIFDNDVLGTLSRFLDPGSLGSEGATLVVDGMEARKVGVSLSGIQQVKINQDPYAAEFQRPGRGRIEVITKAGSDAYHGSLDVTLRDARLNARDPFAETRVPEQRDVKRAVIGVAAGLGDDLYPPAPGTLELRGITGSSLIFTCWMPDSDTPTLRASIPSTTSVAPSLPERPSGSRNHERVYEHVVVEDRNLTKRRRVHHDGVPICIGRGRDSEAVGPHGHFLRDGGNLEHELWSECARTARDYPDRRACHLET